MTSNQHRAVALAQVVIAGKVQPADVTDGEWALLLLAADLCECRPPPQSVAGRVLEQFDHRQGYFALASTNAHTVDSWI